MCLKDRFCMHISEKSYIIKVKPVEFDFLCIDDCLNVYKQKFIPDYIH